jgi:hypothetical protein
MKKQVSLVSNWSIKGVITITILSAMLCTFGAKANNKPSVALNATTIEKLETNLETVDKYNAAEFVQSEMENEIANRMISNEEVSNVGFETVEGYNSGEFVNADMAREIETWTNSDSEISNGTIEAGQYNAGQFVQAEIEHEIESWMNNSRF